jgi:hypothetical protein
VEPGLPVPGGVVIALLLLLVILAVLGVLVARHRGKGRQSR